MREYTFVVITYNQQKYILEHLESIKNQIIKFGSEYKNYLVICDDHSNDNTIRYAKEWLIYNKHLFENHSIIIQPKNKGIVNNYLSGLREVKTSMFSIMAGDDLYFDNSIYEAAEISNFVYTPRISFDSYNQIHREELWLFKRCIMRDTDLKKEMLRWMNYRMVIDDMSVRWRSEFCTESFYKMVGKYKWVEDYTSMLAILKNPSVEVKLSLKPVVLYRDDSGISTRPKNNLVTEYNMEQKKLFSDYHLKISTFPKYINPNNYYFVLWRKLNSIEGKLSHKVQEFQRLYDSECDRAAAYLTFIKNQSDNFLDKFI